MNTFEKFRTLLSQRQGCLLIRTLLLLAVLFLASPVTHSWASTTITSKTISVSENWTLAGSPYQVSGAVTVNLGATLTIDPGVVVTVNAGGFYIYGNLDRKSVG